MGRSTQDINEKRERMERNTLMGRSISAEGFLNGIYVLFLFTIKLGRVVYNLTLVSTYAFVARTKV